MIEVKIIAKCLLSPNKNNNRTSNVGIPKEVRRGEIKNIPDKTPITKKMITRFLPI